jgi:hypothetical protein
MVKVHGMIFHIFSTSNATTVALHGLHRSISHEPLALTLKMMPKEGLLGPYSELVVQKSTTLLFSGRLRSSIGGTISIGGTSARNHQQGQENSVIWVIDKSGGNSRGAGFSGRSLKR